METTVKPNLPLNSTSAIKYSGEVKIKYVDSKTGKRKRHINHNEGKLPLFTFICRAIAGESSAKYRPQYIMLYGEQDEKLISSPIPLLTAPKLYNETPTAITASSTACNAVELTFNINALSFVDLEKAVKKLTLLNSVSENIEDENRICASMDLSTEIIPQAGTNMLIYWKLKISSKET